MANNVLDRIWPGVQESVFPKDLVIPNIPIRLQPALAVLSATSYVAVVLC
jgi:hypothetical protein